MQQRARRYAGLLDDLCGSGVAHVGDVATKMAARRGRPLRVVESGIVGDGPCGALLVSAEEDVIVVDARTTALHRDHIIAHELAHVALGHCSDESSSSAHLAALFPGIDASVVRAVLGRGAFDDAEECDAEMLASMLMTRLASRPARRQSDIGTWQELYEAIEL